MAAIVVALNEGEFPTGFWDNRQAWAMAARVALVIVAAVEPLRALRARHLDQRDHARAGLVEESLYYTLVAIDEATSDQLKWHDIGIHVWEVTGPFSWRNRFRFGTWKVTGPTSWLLHLKRVARVRIKSSPRGHGRLRFRPGVGAVGHCWKTQEGGVWDASNFPPATKAEFEAMTDEGRMGFSWDQATRAKGYGCIVVAPMFSAKGAFRGCVSADGPPGTYQTMGKAQVRRIVIQCANLCAEKLYGANDE